MFSDRMPAMFSPRALSSTLPLQALLSEMAGEGSGAAGGQMGHTAWSRDGLLSSLESKHSNHSQSGAHGRAAQLALAGGHLMGMGGRV